MRGRALAAVGVTAAAIPLAASPPARAADTAAGAAAFDGFARLPGAGECPGAEAPGCRGEWRGSFTGEFSGVFTDNAGRATPWSVELDAPGSASLAASPAGGCGPLTGTATFAGGVNQAFGAFGDGVPVPKPVIGAQVSLSFEWDRQGTTGPLAVTALVVRLDVYGVGWVTVIDDHRAVSVPGAMGWFVSDQPLDCAVSAPGQLAGQFGGALSGIAVRAN